MLDLLATEAALSLLLLLSVVVGTYIGLHKAFEHHMIRKGLLKPLKETSWDDVRTLRDNGHLYWALKRFRQLKHKVGRHLTYRSAMEQLQEL